jgi:hypothetical protein
MERGDNLTFVAKALPAQQAGASVVGNQILRASPRNASCAATILPWTKPSFNFPPAVTCFTKRVPLFGYSGTTRVPTTDVNCPPMMPITNKSGGRNARMRGVKVLRGVRIGAIFTVNECSE